MAGLSRCSYKEATMKVGLFHYLSTAYAIVPAVLAKRAEELGFDSLWLPEHPIMPVTTVTPFPLGGPIPAFYADFIDPFVGCVFHAKPATDSTANLPPVPHESCH